jgi:hypothetical protein
MNKILIGFCIGMIMFECLPNIFIKFIRILKPAPEKKEEIENGINVVPK